MTRLWKISLALVAAAVLFGAGILAGANKFNKPNTLIHVVTVKWKDGTTDAQRQAALDGVAKMAGEIPGIRNVWLKSIKVQPREFTHAFVMEFDNKAALDAYAKHPAHDAWLKVYSPVHEESRTSDIVN